MERTLWGRCWRAGDGRVRACRTLFMAIFACVVIAVVETFLASEERVGKVVNQHKFQDHSLNFQDLQQGTR